MARLTFSAIIEKFATSVWDSVRVQQSCRQQEIN